MVSVRAKHLWDKQGTSLVIWGWTHQVDVLYGMPHFPNPRMKPELNTKIEDFRTHYNKVLQTQSEAMQLEVETG